MRSRGRRPAEPGFDELIGVVRDLPQGKTGQIVNGRLHLSVAQEAAHAHSVAELSATLLAGSPLGDPVPNGWTFLTEVELALPAETLVVADIAGWHAPHDRIMALPSPIGLVPHWICEVLDPGTRTLDLTYKRHAYAMAGVDSLWILDPTARVLEVYDNLRGRWLLSLAVSEDEVAAAPFSDLHFDVSDLWMPEPPHPPHRPSHRVS